MRAIPKRAAAAATIISIIIYHIWGLAVPLARWQISIPIAIDHDTEATLPYPTLETTGILASYRAVATPILQQESDRTGCRWNIAYVSSPAAGLSLTLTAPFDSSIAKQADILVSHLADALETTRSDLFASIGLKLAHDIELLEADRTSSGPDEDPLSDESQLEKLDEMSQNLTLAAENLNRELVLIEAEAARLKSAARKAPPRVTPAKPRTRIQVHPCEGEGCDAPTRVRVPVPRRAPAGRSQSTVVTPGDAEALRRLKTEITRIRQEIDLIAQSKQQVDARRRTVAMTQTGQQQKKAELTQLLEQNKALTNLFKSGYGKLDLSRQARVFPSRILDVWFAAQPLGLLSGPVLIWLALRRRKAGSQSSILCDQPPVIGTIPALPVETVEDMLRPLSFSATSPRDALTLTKMAADLARKADENECRTIAVVGSHRGCGTSVAAALMTAAFVNDQKRPLLIDLHWKRPAQHRLWWLPWASGTVNWLASNAVPTEISRGNPDKMPCALVVPAGPLPPCPEKALESAPWKLWLGNFPRETTQYLFADIGNVEDSPDLTVGLTSAFDGFVLVSRRETPEQAENAAEMLARSGRPFLGYLYAGDGDTAS